MTIDNELEEAAYEMETSLFDEDSHPDLLREAANHIRAQEARIAELTENLETERMRLAACGVVAMANTPESAAKFRQMNDKYRSASLNDVIRCVDEEMKLRNQVAELTKDAEPAPAPAPKAVTADMVTDEVVAAWLKQVNSTLSWKEGIAAAVNAFNGVKP